MKVMAYSHLGTQLIASRYLLARMTGLEPATYGFGDRCSAN